MRQRIIVQLCKLLTCRKDRDDHNWSTRDFLLAFCINLCTSCSTAREKLKILQFGINGKQSLRTSDFHRREKISYTLSGRF